MPRVKKLSARRPAADVKAVKARSAEWWSVGLASLENFVSYYAHDATLFPPQAPMAKGKDAIRAVIGGLMSLPGFALAGRAVKIQVAQAGDLAWEAGTFEMTANDSQGRPATQPGKYVVIWKKQPNGQWRVIADIFNMDG